jgi:hypothetical protein
MKLTKDITLLGEWISISSETVSLDGKVVL